MAKRAMKPTGDWRKETLERMRKLIFAADRKMTEEQKWKKPSNSAGVPVWSHEGIVCTGETYKQTVKLTFARGASLPDPSGLFNASLDGGTRRAIDIHEGEELDAAAFKALIKAAVAANKAAKTGAATKEGKPTARTAKPVKLVKPVKLLAGGNPQIAKADGDEAVQAYIAAMPGWKQEVGQRLDSLIARAVPKVKKAIKWNTPFYGVDGQGWFLGFHCVTKYVKVAFFRGASLRPVPPVESKQKEVRYFHIHEGEEIDKAKFTAWVKQAAALPGWMS
jgi:hypothetical protein